MQQELTILCVVCGLNRRRAQKPLEALSSNLDASIALLKASLSDTRAAAAASKAAAAVRSSSNGGGRVRSAAAVSKCSAPGPQDVPKSVASKHIMRYTCEEVSITIFACDIRFNYYIIPEYLTSMWVSIEGQDRWEGVAQQSYIG